MKNNYNFEDYKKGVLSFNEETKNWEALDEYKFYTACNTFENWEETPDNANGGLSISWAFHKDEISESEILTHFYEEIINILNANIDNETLIVDIELNY